MLDSLQLQQLENFASLFFGIEDLAILLEVESKQLQNVILNKNAPEYRRYQKGRLLCLAELRKTQISMAKNGSTPAYNHIIELWENMKVQEI